jgi:uncharacterized protein
MADSPPRLSSLDALRGLAILGILVVNVQAFAFVAAARWNPTVQGNLAGANWWVWLGTHVLFDGKFIAIFAMLFGASIVLQAESCARRGVSAARTHYRRMAVLLAVGVLHAHLLWYGDWLAILAVCGALAFLYRGLPPRTLVTAGVLVFAIGSAISVAVAWSLPWWSPEAAERLVADWAPSPEAIAAEVALYRSGWLDQMRHRVPTAFRLETSDLATRSLWQMTGLMLVGMALLKLGVLGAGRSPVLYAAMAAIGAGVGIPLILHGVGRSMASGWDLRAHLAIDGLFNYWGGLLVSLSWIATVMLLIRLGWRMKTLAVVGRLALTNYLMQTLICTTIFYGHGLGLFARVDRVGQLAIVAGVWAVQLITSAWWVRHFAFGPAEWLWRSIAYGRWAPIRRTSSDPPGTAAGPDAG